MPRFLLALAFLATPALATTAPAEVPRVVADTPITHSLVAQVMGDLGAPELLLDQGADPHDFQLRPSQARLIAAADLVVWMSSDLSPWMARAVQTLATGTRLELAGVEGLHRQGFLAGQLALGHAGEADDHAAASGLDPHLWLDPQNAAPWLHALAAELARLDPQNGASYAANAEAAVAASQRLAAELAEILAPVTGIGLVTHHDAYGYLAQAYGLTLLGSVTQGDAADPGVARISALRAALARLDPPPCLLPEANHPQAVARLVAEGLDLRIGPALDPAGVMQAPGAGHYGATLRALARNIAACASGA